MKPSAHTFLIGLIFGFVWGATLTLAICLTFGNAFPEEMWPSWTGIPNP